MLGRTGTEKREKKKHIASSLLMRRKSDAVHVTVALGHDMGTLDSLFPFFSMGGTKTKKKTPRRA